MRKFKVEFSRPVSDIILVIVKKRRFLFFQEVGRFTVPVAIASVRGFLSLFVADVLLADYNADPTKCIFVSATADSFFERFVD